MERLRFMLTWKLEVVVVTCEEFWEAVLGQGMLGYDVQEGKSPFTLDLHLTSNSSNQDFHAV